MSNTKIKEEIQQVEQRMTESEEERKDKIVRSDQLSHSKQHRGLHDTEIDEDTDRRVLDASFEHLQLEYHPKYNFFFEKQLSNKKRKDHRLDMC